ncbi:CNP1-like family protein [Thiobaca trueperi]|uniref:CNP1-like family protein n=1 Tax=Thiobaca trueperi TaxID=127458 RepID=A0A4R3MWU5_9GAMM|nr:CNP1-like family protein [Thiobaca trueperi]TCT20834.1 CNP1-like family protein [Thiobaca trueperi]
MRHACFPPLCLLLIWTASSQAANEIFVPDAEPPVPSSVKDPEAWREGPTALPPWPDNADLVEFTPDGPPTAFRYFIDSKHLQVSADGVVRYTLVVESSGGTRNLSFEGIRCTLRGQYKVFAYGASGRFDLTQGAEWQPISEQASERYRGDLWRFHFCVPREMKPRPKKDMIRSLRGQIAPRQNTGFQAD